MASPVDRLRQADQLVVHVQDQVETHRGDQGLLVGLRLGFRLHSYTGFGASIPTFLVYRICDRFPPMPVKYGLHGLSKADSIFRTAEPAS